MDDYVDVSDRVKALIAEIDKQMRQLLERKQAIIDGAAAAMDIPPGWRFDGKQFFPPDSAGEQE